MRISHHSRRLHRTFPCLLLPQLLRLLSSPSLRHLNHRPSRRQARGDFQLQSVTRGRGRVFGHLPLTGGVRLNYAEMERKFTVYIYPNGDQNTFFQMPRKLTWKYSSEGYFFQNIRKGRFQTEDPGQAQLFFIPISCHKMRGKGTSYENMTIIVQNYVESF
ncbi:uncharacterized protein LOC121052487 [Rosa chinensis]|uniref:uncharacterized protein LOC121052487 n=1 Tax=Rosa chinensis TaxID=74649 RepID=UPI001AD94ABA|nr:uncharacterized protein LOC121052487 [Rosa chinensis]